MSRQMIFDVDNAAQQPTIVLSEFYNLRALIDTGSMLPMWIKDRDLLEELGGVPLNREVNITGVSGTEAGKALYRINVPFGEIIYKDMPIIYNPIYSDNLKNVHIVFGATNFRGMRYTLDTENNKLIVELLNNQMVINVHTEKADGTPDILIAESKD